jgi:hypothetical protein
MTQSSPPDPQRSQNPPTDIPVLKKTKRGFVYNFAATVTTLSILVLLLSIVEDIYLHQPAIVLAGQSLTIACITFILTIPAILLSVLRNSRRSADYLEHIAQNLKY